MEGRIVTLVFDANPLACDYGWTLVPRFNQHLEHMGLGLCQRLPTLDSSR